MLPAQPQPAGPTTERSVATISVRESPRPSARRLSIGLDSEDEQRRVLTWLEEGLRPDQPGRLTREFPLLFAPGSRWIPVTLWEQGRPVSFCAVWPTSFSLAGGAIRAGLISLVYTDPRARGAGRAGEVVDAAVRAAAERGLGLCLLWSSLASFYARRGFSRHGREQLLVVDRAVLDRARAKGGVTPRFRVEVADEAAWDAIVALRTERICRVTLGAEERALARIPELGIRVARSDDGRVAGFAMSGRGEDFPGVVHEWAGRPEAVLDCIASWIPEQTPDAGVLVLAPAARTELAWRLRSAGARRILQPLAWFRVARLDAFAADLVGLAPELAALLADPAIRSAWERDPASLLALAFDPPDSPAGAEARLAFGSRLSETTRSALPLPLFVSGLESI